MLQVLGCLFEDFESRFGISLRGEVSFVQWLHKQGILLAFLTEFRNKLLMAFECRNSRPLCSDYDVMVGKEMRWHGAAKNFCRGIRALVFESDGREMRLPDIPAIDAMYQLGSFLTKFGSDELTDAMVNAALEEYVQIEQDLAVFAVDWDAHPLLARVIPLAQQQVRSLLLFCEGNESRHGKHGPGSVAASWMKHVGDKFCWTPPFPADDDWGVNLALFPGMERYYALAHPHSKLGGPKKDPLMSRVCPVPKNWAKARTICAEPSFLQYAQQSIAAELDDGLRLGRVMGLHQMDLHDQNQNAQAALSGSIFPNYFATLDLSAASDRLTTDVVKLLFPEQWSAKLERVRSHRTELPDHTVLELRKFATMGNACTFPVQSIVFWALATATCAAVNGVEPLEANFEVWVYGDDIILPSSVASELVEVLSALGLKVNQHKSFVTGSFRESCGLHAYEGHVVTPAYLKVIGDTGPACVSMCATANLLYHKGYAKAAECLFAKVENTLKYRLPWTAKPIDLGREVELGFDGDRVGAACFRNAELGKIAKLNWQHSGVMLKVRTLRASQSQRKFVDFVNTGDMWAFCAQVGPEKSEPLAVDRGIIPGRPCLSKAWVDIG